MQKKVHSVVLFFGSFNPIHSGHINIARYIIQKALAHELWFVVSPQSPHKTKGQAMDAKQRVRWIEQCIQKEDRMHVCTIELELPIPSYSFNTISELKKQYPDIEFSMLIGSDNLAGFSTWKNAELILNMLKQVYVYPRNRKDTSLSDKKPFVLLKSPMYDFSSTEIREKIQRKESVQGMVPDQILEEVILLYKN